MKGNVGWLIGGVLILMGLGEYLTFDTNFNHACAGVWILAGILSFPPVLPVMEEYMGARIKQRLKYTLVLWLFFVGLSMMRLGQNEIRATDLGDTSSAAYNANEEAKNTRLVIWLISGSILAARIYMTREKIELNGEIASTQPLTDASTFINQPAPVQQADTIYKSPSPAVTPHLGIADEIKKLSDLHAKGALTAEEYARLKEKLMG